MPTGELDLAQLVRTSHLFGEEAEAPMERWRAEALDHVRNRVWSGDSDPGDVFDIIANIDMVHEGVFSTKREAERGWLRDAIQSEFRTKREAERGWPEITDCDRLEQVFEALHSRGILTDDRWCGSTVEDGLGVIDDLYEEEGGEHPGFVGYCFFHLQDMERAIWSDVGLLLAYGSFSDSSEHGVEVGHLIREECERAGFEVIWDGTIESRILLKGFRWQRRSPVTGPDTATDYGRNYWVQPR
jgi:hypothetical protein